MKLFNRFSVMAAIVSTFVLAGCTDDVYDPERGIQTVPKENPLGEDFSAPDSFDWSMINAINLNVEVKDEFNGRYKYLIEVFTDNPISNAGGYCQQEQKLQYRNQYLQSNHKIVYPPDRSQTA